MRPESETPGLLGQLLDQNRVSVVSLRDFKKTARDLIKDCRKKSNIHPLLADHVFREAERYIEIIDNFEESLTSNKKVSTVLLSLSKRNIRIWDKLICVLSYKIS